MKESDISRAIQIAATKEGWRLFRQNVGTAWTGNVVSRSADLLTLSNPRPLRAGLCVGSGDLIGWVPAMVNGARVGVFASVEVKTPRGRVSEDQTNFLRNVQAAHGIALIARSPEEAIEEIRRAVAALSD